MNHWSYVCIYQGFELCAKTSGTEKKDADEVKRTMKEANKKNSFLYLPIQVNNILLLLDYSTLARDYTSYEFSFVYYKPEYFNYITFESGGYKREIGNGSQGVWRTKEPANKRKIKDGVSS